MEDISTLIKLITPLIFSILLIKYRRKYGIMSFLFLIVNGYVEFPTWVHIVFWSLTALLTCAENDTMKSIMNHNINYDVHDIQSEIKTREIFKNTFKKFDNIAK